MVLNYAALGMTILGLIAVFYTFIYIHELPYEAAKHRNHPHTDAIYVACWLSLFTLHAIWPLVFIWALTHKAPEGNATAGHGPVTAKGSLADDQAAHIQLLEERLRRLEMSQPAATSGSSAT